MLESVNGEYEQDSRYGFFLPILIINVKIRKKK
jgi:hypothetical protein